MKILLLQARRANDPAKTEELSAFADKAGLSETAFTSHDLLTCPPSIAEVLTYDAVMVGGAGEFDVSKKNLPCFDEALALLAAIVEAGHPMFASCFGFQLLTSALGGAIIYDGDNMEVGTFTLMPTEAAPQDELFGYLPNTFQAQLGRKDRASRLPDGVINLASSARCPYQAFRIPDKPIWAAQFHPELSYEENKLRFARYQQSYTAMMGEEAYEEALSRFGESPETEELIPRFLRIIGAK